jgi:hypothetical protein
MKTVIVGQFEITRFEWEKSEVVPVGRPLVSFRAIDLVSSIPGYGETADTAIANSIDAKEKKHAEWLERQSNFTL